MEKYASAVAVLHNCAPAKPIVAIRPHMARRAARFFLESFPGKVLYALKANNMPEIVDVLYEAGIRAFDVASLTEIEQVSKYEQAELYLMNPVKPRLVIAEAYYKYGVRNFALDSLEELQKVLEETGFARDLNLFVRISCSGKGAQIGLDHKFGVSGQAALDLLMAVRNVSVKLGVTFHAGSQLMEPERFGEALDTISDLIAKSGVLPDVIDVGGGFPSIYPGLTPPPMTAYMASIKSAFERMKVVETCELICEPGRALVAEAGSLIARVEARRGNNLYINDGSYGCLHDAAHYGFVYPSRLIRGEEVQFGTLQPFSLYGPTCDSADYMPGPFYFPDCILEGDLIEIGQLGAYGHVMQTFFNGFGQYEYAVLEDEPMLSLYEPDVDDEAEQQAVSL